MRKDWEIFRISTTVLMTDFLPPINMTNHWKLLWMRISLKKEFEDLKSKHGPPSIKVLITAYDIPEAWIVLTWQSWYKIWYHLFLILSPPFTLDNTCSMPSFNVKDFVNENSPFAFWPFLSMAKKKSMEKKETKGKGKGSNDLKIQGKWGDRGSSK